MLIAITGGSGFIGRRLIKKLVESSYNLLLLGRSFDRPSISDLIKEKKVDYIKYDLTNRNPEISNTLRNVDVLVHLAAFVPRSNKPSDDDPIKNIEVNIKGTHNLLKDFENVAEKLIFASTLEVYGKPVFLPITEFHPVNPLTYYGASKLAAEKYVTIFSFQHNMKSVILRFSTVYGPEEVFDRAIPNFIRCVMEGKSPVIYGDGLDVRDYIYIDDAVDAIVAAIHRDCEGVYNIASGEGYTIHEIFEKIKDISGKDLKPIFKRSNREPTKFIFDIISARKELGFSPKVSIDHGLTEEFSWYKKVKHV